MATPLSWLRNQRTTAAPIPAPRAAEPPQSPLAPFRGLRRDCGCFGRYSTCRCPGPAANAPPAGD